MESGDLIRDDNTAAEPPARPRHRLRHGQRWGRWVLNARALTLACENYSRDGYEYEVDLEQCETSAQTLDIIMRVTAQPWCTRQDAGALLAALSVILDPHATLCSFADTRLEVAPYVRSKLRTGRTA